MVDESKPASQTGRSILSQINHADHNLMNAHHDSSQADISQANVHNVRDSIYFDSNLNELKSSVSPSVA